MIPEKLNQLNKNLKLLAVELHKQVDGLEGKINAIAECEAGVTQLIENTKLVVEHLRAVAPEHLAELKSELLGLFETEESNSVVVAKEDAEKKQPYTDLVLINEQVGYLRTTGEGKILAVYIGGNNRQRLKQWGDIITYEKAIASGYELREGRRLETKWELRLSPMPLCLVERLARWDFTKEPHWKPGTTEALNF